MKPIRQSPLYVFLQVLAIVFGVEAGVMLLLPALLSQRTPSGVQAFADSCLLTVISAPLLWWAIIRPLRRLAVTEQAKAEAIEAAARQGIITFDHRGIIDSFSPAAEQVFGYAAEEVVGEELSTLIPWQFLARYQDASKELPGPPRLVMGTVKIPGRRKDGSEVPLSVSISEVCLDGPPLYTAVVRDLVDRERDEMRAEQMAAVAQLGSAFAHRLRNPLTSIKMLVQAGSRQQDSLTLDREDLRIIEDEVRRMERSLEMFLDFARPRKMEHRRVALSEVVAEAIAGFEARAAQKGVAIQFSDRASAPAILGDPERLRELTGHLVQNAIDATSPGGAIHIELRSADSEQIELRVADSGTGIPASVLSQLFQPFVTTKTTGVGLGLVISRRIAEEHGGRLVACNRPQGGSCFILTLPAPCPAETLE